LRSVKCAGLQYLSTVHARDLDPLHAGLQYSSTVHLKGLDPLHAGLQYISTVHVRDLDPLHAVVGDPCCRSRTSSCVVINAPSLGAHEGVAKGAGTGDGADAAIGLQQTRRKAPRGFQALNFMVVHYVEQC
jgi:hypothetical protein